MQESYREIFLAESQEYMNIISQCLVKLEEKPSDLESLNEIFRAMHTLKGMSATMGFEKLAQLSHQMEDLLDALRSQKIKVNSEIIDSLFGCLDVFEALVEEIKLNKKTKIDIGPHLENVKRFLQMEEAVEEAVEEAPEVSLDALNFADYEQKLFEDRKSKGYEIFKIKVSLTKTCTMKQVRAFLVVTSLEKIGQILKSVPSADDLKQGKFTSSFAIMLATREKDEGIRRTLLSISEVEEVEIEPLEFLYEKQAPGRAAPSYIKKIQSMRIPVYRLDKIMNLMGELTIAKIRFMQIVQSERLKPLEDVSFIIDRLTTALQDEVMLSRLLPISHILDTFSRIVRDLARGQNKQVELEITGSEIELDRAILDEIGDPLVHLVRNAIDHGVEAPEERKGLKKNPKGKIIIKVARQKGQISIEVADDGRGIDFETVGRSALKKGLISEEESAKLDKERVLSLLMLPGFTTSEKISEISGRGVGLDVVRAKMEAMAGRLDFETEKGKGTRFILTLPLTLAIIKAMLVKVCEETFAIPLMSIRETIKIEQKELKLIKNFEVIRVRNEVIPIIRLDKELEICTQSRTAQEEKGRQDEQRISVVIVEYGTKSIGLVVNKVLGEQDIVVKPLGSMIKRLKGIAGATILSDGKVALILDVLSLR
ncbi:MAG: chemotaxis protein CheA [Candidatus Omnitrophota bacterium]